jgi:CHAD domain-containing protein
MSTPNAHRPGSVVAKRLAQAARHVFVAYPRALLGEARAVHQLRVAVRRLRVTLALLAPKPGGKTRRRADRVLRQIGRAVSGSRDVQVSAKLFERFLPRRAQDRSGWPILRRALAARQARALRLSKDNLLDLEIAALRVELRAIHEHSPIELPDLQVRLRKLVDADGSVLIERLRTVGRRFHPDALHDVRRAARRLRYAAELADALFGQDCGAPKRFRALQNLIGAIHDRHILAQWLEQRVNSATRAGDAALARTARSARNRILRDARRLHRELLAADPAGLVSAALAAMRPEEPVAEGDAIVLPFPDANAR